MKQMLSPIMMSLALIVAACIAPTAASADPVMSVTTVNTQGQTDEYLARLADTIAIAQELSPDGKWRVWVASYSGTSTGTVYVTVEYPSMAAMAAADEASDASAEFQASIARLAELGRTIVSRAILNEGAL